jgi:hypothetical protein
MYGDYRSALEPELMPLRAAHVRCTSCHCRLRAVNVCELGVVDSPALCPRIQPDVRVPARQ